MDIHNYAFGVATVDKEKLNIYDRIKEICNQVFFLSGPYCLNSSSKHPSNSREESDAAMKDVSHVQDFKGSLFYSFSPFILSKKRCMICKIAIFISPPAKPNFSSFGSCLKHVTSAAFPEIKLYKACRRYFCHGSVVRK